MWLTVRRAALFPGQGAQVPGMGEPWRDSPAWPVVDEICAGAGVDVGQLLLHADADVLRRTDNAQLAMFAMGVLAFRDAQLRGSTDDIVAFAGHSLGEYVALVAAEAISVADAAHVVAHRGAAMHAAAERVQGTMVVIAGADVAVVQPITLAAQAAGESVWIANLNGPKQVVLAGTAESIEAVAGAVDAAGLRSIRIPVGGAFHCPLMESAAQVLAESVHRVGFASAHRPVVANVDAAVRARDANWPELLVRQLTAPVRWHESMKALAEQLDCSEFVVFGQAKALVALTKRAGLAVRATAYGPGLTLSAR